MPVTKNANEKLPSQWNHLVRMMPPQAIMDDVQYENTVEMIDRLMAFKATKGRRLYLETLVQLVQAYEDKHHSIETADLSGIEVLRQLLSDNHLNASDLARLLGVHVSMGSKILNGQRALTVEHVRKLASRFKVRSELFIA